MRLDEAARTFIGVKWQHQGRTVFGLDCVGLVVASMAACGLPCDDRTDYSHDPDGTLYAHLCDALDGPFHWYQPGDVVLVQFSARVPRHVAIVSESEHGMTVIHSDSHVGKVSEHLIDDRWHSRIVGAWRAV